MTKKATPKAETIVSFSLSGPHLLSMLARLGDTPTTLNKTAPVLISTKAFAEDYSSDELSVTSAGHPASVVARTTTGEGKGLLVHKAGEFVVSIKDLSSLVRAMPEDILDITVDSLYKIRIEPAGHASKPKVRRFVSQALEPENYPPVARINGPRPTRTLPAAVLGEMLDKVRFAYDGISEDRVGILGVMLEFDKDKVTAIATNGHVFAAFEHAGTFTEGQVFLPKPIVELLIGIVKNAESVVLTEDESRCYAETAFTALSCLRPVANFIPWRSMVSLPCANTCTVDGPQLVEAARALQTVGGLTVLRKAGDKDEAKVSVPLRIMLREGSLSLTAHMHAGEVDMAGAEETLEVNNPEQHTFSFIVDALLLAQTARRAGGVVTFGQNQELDPVLLKSDGFTALVMPARE